MQRDQILAEAQSLIQAQLPALSQPAAPEGIPGARQDASLYSRVRPFVAPTLEALGAGGGALLGDRIRMNSLDSDRVFFRSIATRRSASEVPDVVPMDGSTRPMTDTALLSRVVT